MLVKKTPFKKNFGRIAIGLIFLAFLFCVYLFSAFYFEHITLTKKALSGLDERSDYKTAPPPTIISKKVDEKVISFYSFFFDLTKLVASQKTLDEGERSDATLYLGGFSYTAAVVDLDKTSLYFEGVANAIVFKPDYRWEQVEQSLLLDNKDKFDKHRFNSFEGAHDDKRCIDNNCLEVRGNKVFYNAKSVTLPLEIKAKDIHAISLGNVESKWLIGFTLKKNGYEGQVFYFDGVKFSKLPNFKTISSQYPGMFGFGGIQSDFLVLYGAYKGQAFRVQGEKIKNLDKFFEYRVTNGGFKPEVIRAQSDNYINWYIYSSTLDNPRFLKLWEDDKGEIVGVISLLADVKISGQTSELKLVEVASDSVSLISKVREGNYESWRLFKDFGFLNDDTKVLISAPMVYDSNNTHIYIKKINENSLFIDEEGKKLVKIEFSLDGSNWQEVPIEKNIDFVQKPTDRYFLKIIFSPVDNKFYSPYIDKIVFSYLYKK